MAICAALLQYGYTNFNLYVLETFPELTTRKQLLIREDYFVSLVKPPPPPYPDPLHSLPINPLVYG
jgi:hypothetical protein